MRDVTRLGYLGFEVSDLDRWSLFASEVLGLGVTPTPDGAGLSLRMDGNERAFILTRGNADDIAFAGWEAADEAALDVFAAGLAAQQIPYLDGTAEEARLRGVERLIAFIDPSGARHEAYFGPIKGAQRYVSPQVAGGFRTGDGGIGHIVYGSHCYRQSIDFARNALGVSLSDVIRQPNLGDPTFEVTFLHVNERHHSIAFAKMPENFPTGGRKLHHFMIEVNRVDEVGRARDRALKHGFEVPMDIGQHPNDEMISIYVKTPSGFLVEFGWGGRLVDDANWHVTTYPVLSEWGHRPYVGAAQ